MSVFWMEAEMDRCEDRANGVLLLQMEPLAAAIVRIVIGISDCTDGRE
jgi:hypothetical protein